MIDYFVHCKHAFVKKDLPDFVNKPISHDIYFFLIYKILLRSSLLDNYKFTIS